MLVGINLITSQIKAAQYSCGLLSSLFAGSRIHSH